MPAARDHARTPGLPEAVPGGSLPPLGVLLPFTGSGAPGARERLRRLEERLQRLESLASLGQRAAQIAHEVRTPITGIEGFASLLCRDLAADDPRRELAERILQGARHLRHIVCDVLALAGPSALHRQEVSLRAVLDEAVALVAAARSHRRAPALAIERHYAPEADTVMADPDRLRQVFLNLLLNADDAVGNQGQLALAIEPAPDTTRDSIVRICDSGPGIPLAAQPRIFEPFFTTKSGGTGLGLSHARRLVKLHGGTLSVQSRPGRGTTAVLRLPHAGDTPRRTPI